jgi:hypothetical protein
MIRRLTGVLAVLLCVLALPALADAQSVIRGVVKDTSGAVLPGVTVEASSDALIEKSKSVVTDGEGAYRIVDLRPGVYVVTFTLTGFSTIRREGIDLPAEFTMSLNADMRVGALEESITVTGAAPIVDVTSAAHTQVLDREAIDNIPTGRTIQSIGQIITGVSLSLPDVGGSRAAMQTYMSVRGNTAANNTVLVDGMQVNGLEANGAVQGYFNDQMSQELSYQTAGIDASVSSGGVRLNMIPKEGGNRFSGSSTVSIRPGAWQGDNFTERLQSAGLGATNTTEYIFDFTASEGGPIVRDKVWFFGSFREYRTNNGVANTFQDDGGQGQDLNYIRQGLGRVTYQLSQKHKIAGYYDRVSKYRSNDMQSLYDPETASRVWTTPNYSTGSVKLTSTLTSKLLLEGGWAFNIERRDTEMQEGIEKERGTPEWFAGASHALANTTLGGAANSAISAIGSEWPDRYSYNLGLSYVSGAHHVKGGMNGTYGKFFHAVRTNADLYQEYANVNDAAYRAGTGPLVFSNPVSVVIRNTPLLSGEELNTDMGFYIQDTWSMRRLTLSAGVRYELLNSSVSAFTAPAGRFVPERNALEQRDLPDWDDWAPRFQAVYDVFGNAKTAIKYSINRYNASQTTSIADDFNPLSSITQRVNWTDVNGDNVAQGARTWNANGTFTDCAYPSVGCEINLSQLRANFGLVDDPGVYGGFPRQYSIEQGVEVQHELLPRLSVTANFYYGDFKNLTTTLNRSVTPADYTAVQIFNPETGQPITIYNQSAASIARPSDNITFVDEDRLRKFDSYGVDFRYRASSTLNLFGGMTWGRTRETGIGTVSATNNCTVGRLQNPNLSIFCDEFNLENGDTVPYQRDLRLNGSYTLPWQEVMLSASFQSNDGGNLAQNYTVTRATRYPNGTNAYLVANQPAPACPAPCTANALVIPTLGQASQVIPLRPDETVRNDRLNQLDIKVQKTFRVRGVTITPNFEAFNINNSDKVITYQSTSYAISTGAYLKPNSVVQGRILGVGTSVRW